MISFKLDPELNIRKLSGLLMKKLILHLDTAPESNNWRALVSLLQEPYIFSQDVIENFAMKIYGRGSPSDSLLMALSGLGMNIKDLAYYLDRLRLEKILLDLWNYEKVEIKDQPAQIVKLMVGEKLILSVQASGFPYPRYQWFKDQNRVNGAIENKLVFDRASESTSGHYICRLHNNGVSADVVFSDYSEVRVYQEATNNGLGTRYYPKQVDDGIEKHQKISNDDTILPVIVSHPRDATIFNGSTFYLVCTAIGKQPMRYQWIFENDRFCSESNSCVLQIDNVGASHSGKYICRVTNDYGEASSIPAIIAVVSQSEPIIEPIPRILIEPSGCHVESGGVAVFTIEALGGSNLRYQWFQNNICLPGNSPQLILQGVQMNAVIKCRISNEHGAVFSQNAILDVSMSPIYSRYTATDKVALLIGNYNYRCEKELMAPKTDIQTLARIFTSMEFKVVSLLNLTLQEMKAAVSMFCELLDSGVYAVFYFCGHGFEENGVCYLIPEDAQTDSSEKDCLSAHTVLSLMQARDPKICNVILDICRKRNKNKNLELPSNEILIPELKAGNYCICYATCIGLSAYEVGNTGKLVEHLQNHLALPIKIEDVFSRMRDGIGRDKKVENIQIPEIRTSILQTERSFCDPISYRNGGTAAFKRRSLAWEGAHLIPKTKTLEAEHGVVLLLEFQSNFSNVLQVFVIVKDKGTTEHCISWITHLPLTVSIMDVPKQVCEGKTKNLIQDIQKLKGDLIVDLVIQYKLRDGPLRKMYKKHINLGLPLVSKLWALNLVRSTEREPTEQAEELEPGPQ